MLTTVIQFISCRIQNCAPITRYLFLLLCCRIGIFDFVVPSANTTAVDTLLHVAFDVKPETDIASLHDPHVAVFIGIDAGNAVDYDRRGW